MVFMGKAEGAEVDTATKMVHTSLFSGGVGFVLGSTRGMLGEARVEHSTSWRNASGVSWQMAARESALFAVVGATFVGGSVVAESIRGKDDVVNRMLGACAGGAVIGARKASAFQAILACPAFAFVALAADISDNRLRPPKEVNQKNHPELQWNRDA
uniref:Uncharacterized protein n=1 Tax=Hemiselmis andersenii TaxID=464988 RepID=A0A6U2C1B2_HEMAN|mmetsp:Transcript_18099/g.41931  ORF Transcript_18099/g.41931 Transcript_18099/m.41931 type:complete len:157 (-) Transcript_18099:184-654(-)